MKKSLAVVLFVIFGLLGFAIFRVFSGPPRPELLADLPPQKQEQRRADAQELVDETAVIVQRAKGRQNGPFTLSATADQLNTLVQDRLRMENLPISDLGVTLEPSRIVVSGTAKRGGFNVPVALSGPLEARNGTLHFEIEDLTLGGFSAPGDWKAKAQRALGGGLEKLFGAAQGARFDRVEIDAERITVSGQTG